MPTKLTRALFGLFLALSLASCGGAAIGEACKTRGSTSECASGGVCDAKTDGTVVCLKACDDDANCATTEACNGVTGTNVKACHPK